MVLERLVTIRGALTDPIWVFLVGGIVSIISLFVSYFVFQTSVGLFSTFIITIAVMPLMLNLIRHEEEVEEIDASFEKMNLFKRHSKILKVYAAFFSGMILSLSILYIILPQNLTNVLFDRQLEEISRIRGGATLEATFSKIITNNLGVLLLSFAFSFLLGAGAIFILAWNAMILAAAIGMAAKGFGGITGLPMAIVMFFPHGSLEILAYFIGGIAGGLISVAIMRKHPQRFWFIAKDTLQLMLLSVVILVIAAAVESFEIVA